MNTIIKVESSILSLFTNLTQTYFDMVTEIINSNKQHQADMQNWVSQFITDFKPLNLLATVEKFNQSLPKSYAKNIQNLTRDICRYYEELTTQTLSFPQFSVNKNIQPTDLMSWFNLFNPLISLASPFNFEDLFKNLILENQRYIKELQDTISQTYHPVAEIK